MDMVAGLEGKVDANGRREGGVVKGLGGGSKTKEMPMKNIDVKVVITNRII